MGCHAYRIFCKIQKSSFTVYCDSALHRSNLTSTNIMNLLLAFSLAFFAVALSTAQRQQIPTQLIKLNKRKDALSLEAGVVAQITERAKAPEAIKHVQYQSVPNALKEGVLTKMDDYCIDGTYVFGSRVVTQLFYINIAIRASGKTCLIGDIKLTGEQTENTTTLEVLVWYLANLLQQLCVRHTLSGVEFNLHYHRRKHADLGDPGLFGLRDCLRLEVLTLDSPQRADVSIYFATLFIINVKNSPINFPSLLGVIELVNVTQDNDNVRGISFLFLNQSPVAMPRIELIYVEDYQIHSKPYSPRATSIYGFLMGNNVQPEEVSFPELTVIAISGGVPKYVGSASAVYLQGLGLSQPHSEIHFDALNTILLETGTAFQIISSEVNVRADALESFQINNTQYSGSLDGLVYASGARVGLFFASLVECNIETALELENTWAFTIQVFGFDKMQVASLPSLRTMKAKSSSRAVGILMFGSSVQMDLRSLKAVSLEAPAGAYTRSVYGGDSQGNVNAEGDGEVASRYASSSGAAAS
eukprot:g55875.t1